MKTAEIRESFLSFFESKGCVRRPSSSLIPDDPSLLLTAAGMVQFKPAFLGVETLPFTRATSVQKCVRTTDIDIIGTTGRHLSFFEMLGNFSFGDYFKREAIRWAWEYSTEVLGLDPERIWASIYLDDDESHGLWLEETAVPAERIVRLGEEDNFWAAGPTGPCGPCSELYYDQGPEFGCDNPECGVGCECDRYLEYWNLVFMEYDRDEKGVLTPLPKQNIDTGMGLERIAAILQNVASNYETDTMLSIMELTEELSGVKYGDDPKSDIALRIITDHVRAVTFMIADGILPSNEGRGYVLRRLLRRAVRYGRFIGVADLFLSRISERVIELMGEAYPEISQHRDLILGIIVAEEERFGTTLRTGLAYLDEALAEVKPGEHLSGLVAFTLHDTYGFPIDLTLEIAAEHNIAVDKDDFTIHMAEQKNRARSHVKDESWNTYGGVYSELAKNLEPTYFTGYEYDSEKATVLALVVDGQHVESAEGGPVEVILDRTPFYGESGGQTGDAGTIVVLNESGEAHTAVLEVSDTQHKEKTLVTHIAVIDEGAISVGDTVLASIDVMRRERIRRNHTAAHLLHWALRKVVGTHVSQAGSSVTPDRLRFDFTHFEGLTREQLQKVERLVNAKVFENHPVRAYETSLSVARESGVTALFGEKYGDFVRVLEVGNFSKELCGGTHIGRTSEIGFFRVVSESSVGANVRRIEGVTSFDAYDLDVKLQNDLAEIAEVFQVSAREAVSKAAAVAKKLKELTAESKKPKSEAHSTLIDQVVATAAKIHEYRVAIARTDGIESGDLKPLWDAVRTNGIDAVVFVGEDKSTGKPIFLAAGNDAAVARGFNAGGLVKEIAARLGGRGGGKPSMAQGGAQDAAMIDEALAGAKTQLEGE